MSKPNSRLFRKIYFFKKIKIKKIKKRLATWRKQAEEDFKNTKKSSYNFGENSKPNCTPFGLKMRNKIQNSMLD